MPITLAALILTIFIAHPTYAQKSTTPVGTDIGTLYPDELATVVKPPGYSPYVGKNDPMRVLWGDTHLHTSNSFDAAAFGNTLGPEAAYRFARGEEVIASTGQPAKLSRPLDFLVVSDHAEGLGSLTELKKGNPVMMSDPTLKRWHDMIGAGGQQAIDVTVEAIRTLGAKTSPPSLFDPRILQSAWENYTATADRYNEPGKFTALIGYEWTSMPGGNNLHRVVIFRDGKDKVDTIVPLSALDNEDPAMLWKFLDAYHAKTGGQALAIPHNGNLSNGLMFGLVDFEGHALTRAYAETRARLEPVYEVTQIKGDGESHRFLSPNDEFAGYEVWDKGNLDMTALKKPEMLQYEYARSALKTGLKLEHRLGINPYKFGMIGSTDSHTSLATADEDNFFGKATPAEPSPGRAVHPFMESPDGKVQIMSWEMVASGYAAVWATENTRAAIFDALMRKEVYATTGPRMVVRFFGGFKFQSHDAQLPDLATIGYAKGVPMGGDLSNAPQGKAPGFLIAAMKDPIGANLDRIQIVKGWEDAKGNLQEKVYDVVWSDPQTRKRGTDDKLPPVGNTVNVPDASYTNSIGAPELLTVWTDPDFEPTLRAFYYGRVIEIPTPRWTAYDAKHFGVTMPKDVPMTTQERAYTSPIWYTPRR
ncbi:DUF3604 domain-containing protein [Caballeronia hypogeia]|uniref:DUF3604 domain-containing protein n=1 Tax=Caballeronia hypogeia TaxID=1777140 RepID=UPI0018E0267D|nr:DUF3604 domain-containing protein [Caballeronia hypogeia]